MKRTWSSNELHDHWQLAPNELDLIKQKRGANRMGFALLLKFFEYEGRFPLQKNEIPRCVQAHTTLPSSFIVQLQTIKSMIGPVER